MQTMFISVSSSQPRYRSGAVARMVSIPVSTLRIWERRYQVVGPSLTASGHRLYTGADVERLLLIKQLIDLGHAVGTVARLGDDALLEIADARAALKAGPASAPGPGSAAAGSVPPVAPAALARVALLGLGLARRLGGLALRRVGTWADLAAAEADLDADLQAHLPADLDTGPSGAGAGAGAAQATGAVTDPKAAQPRVADLLIAEMPTLQPASATQLLALMRRLGAPRTLVVYGFGAEQAAQRLRDAGCRLLRAPLADGELRRRVAELLAAWQASQPAGPSSGVARAGSGPIAGVAYGANSASVNRAYSAYSTAGPTSAGATRAALPPAPRRFDDAALAQLTQLTRNRPRVACECPAHLTELVQLLCNFETYSAECQHSSPDDAALHAHLHQVAGIARAMFEDALALVADAESIPLPG